jgi:hypothetical protein
MKYTLEYIVIPTYSPGIHLGVGAAQVYIRTLIHLSGLFVRVQS